MQTKNLTNDAKAILLLCGRFDGRARADAPTPLTLREYNALADWMVDRKLRPADLLNLPASDGSADTPAIIDVERLKRLLARGAAMALAVEKWSQNAFWVICRSDASYPERLKQHLKKQAPPILYGVGDFQLLRRGGLAVVGSRNVDGPGEVFTREVGAECAKQGIQVVSGGARGVDQTAMMSALESGGTVLGILADSLLKSAVAGKYRTAIREGRLALVSPFHPGARFNVGSAMGRNKLIYAMADYALIVSAEKEKGGTWAGAIEELRRQHPRPLFIRKQDGAPRGNLALLEKGVQPFPNPPWTENLTSILAEQTGEYLPRCHGQRSLFGEIE